MTDEAQGLLAPHATKKKRGRIVYLLVGLGVLTFLIAPLTAVMLRVFVLEAFKVPSGAMIPTIVIGDHLFVDKTARGTLPGRGQVIVFKYPEHPEQDFVKRAVALEGDTIEIHDGKPIINGWTVPSCPLGRFSYSDEMNATTHEGDAAVEFLEGHAYVVFFDHGSMSDPIQGPYMVAPGEAFVMGDNRNNSHDSRMWFGGKGGGVAAALVKGLARKIWMSELASHKGADIAGDPVAPSPELAAPLAKCLSTRPSAEASTPPAARAPR